MQNTLSPVDVITFCGSDGEIRPLRIRAAEADGELFRGNIKEIIRITENKKIGSEARVFLCRAQIGGRLMIVELKFSFRSQCWYLSRRLF